ncbi:MAG: GxxExxY protein [Nanoarchaeota archaeon]|nr:GxxExxY protein [Nanoarchaeota archaeon]
MRQDIIEKELSYKIVGVLFEVQREIGRFARERQYADLVELKLKQRGIQFEREYAIDVADRTSNFVDFLIEGRMVLELKAKPLFEREDFHQTKRYLEVGNFRIGLLVNFRDRYLKPKRILNPNVFEKEFVDSHAFAVSHRSTGQAMVVTTLFISGLILVATTIAGFLVSTQIRQATDTEMSARALFAADAGVEAALYCYRQDFRPGIHDDLNAFCGADKNFSDFGGILDVRYKTSLTLSGTLAAPEGFVVRSEGSAGKTVGGEIGLVRRVLQTTFVSY